MAVYTVSISDGSTLSSLAVAAGRGPKGDGWTSGTYDDTTGIVTFTSNDGLGFSTSDLRPDLSEPGPIGDVTPSTGAFTTLSSTGDAVISGNLTVEGTTTTVDSTTVSIADKNIELAKDAATAAEADGGGITLNGAAATITYSSANDYWALNKGLNVSGNVSLSGTVDGRDVAADGTKLDGIESGATADQTAAEIKTAYESNADTNAFSDAEQTKLSNIEALADVTDTANVTAAGALMDSELTDIAAVKALDQGVATTDSPTFVELTAAQYNSTEALPDIKPSLNLDFANTKALDPRITYTRGSTATYYDGKTFAKAEENLLEYSQEFDNAAWGKTRATVTANADAAPDGTTTADAFLQASGETVSGSIGNNGVSSVAGNYVASVFAKPNGKNFLLMRETLLDGTINDTFFNVSTGAVGSTNAGHTATITASTNSYYRCSIAFTSASSSTGSVAFLLADTDGSFVVADDGNGLYLWGAQLEQRDALSDYTATTTQPITNYVPALQTAASGEPRFDHDPITGESKGFLIEEQRTNLLTYSEQFDNAAWSKVNSSVTSNIVVAPDGTLTGDKLVENTTNSGKTMSDTVTIADNSFITYSCYFKEAGRSRAVLEFYGAGGLNIVINLDAGTINVGTPYDSGTDASGTITPVGNGWYRVSLTLKTKSGDTSAVAQIRLLDDSNNATYTGDGYSGVYIWGAQLEQGSFPTSYIPTVASQVTRSADAASMTGTNFSSWYRQDEGTFYSDAFMDRQNTVGGARVFQAENATSAALGQISVFYRAGGNSGANAVYNGVQFDLNPTGVLSASERLAVCLAYSVNDVAVSGNGGVPTSDNTATIPYIEQIKFGYLPYLNGHIKKLAYYPKRLSNATLQALTEE